MTANRRVHVVVEGRVQGVFFRAYTRDEAIRLGLAGWVRNRPDGSVEAMVEGDKAAVAMMLEWFQQGSPGSKVAKVHIAEKSPLGKSKTFEVFY
jgi:acylphosphatase